MKKVVSISLVIALLLISLLLLSSGTVLAGETVASPHFQATTTPASNAQARLPSGGLAPTPTPNQPNQLPQGGGGTPDGSGTVILIGLGGLLLVSGLALGYRRRKRV